ncbi:hypothetical protein [Profundibacter sp.]
MSGTPETSTFYRIILSCPDQTPNREKLCDAMEQVLKEAAPDRTIVSDTDVIGQNDILIALRVTADEKHSVKAYTEWQKSGGELTRGPEIELVVMDAIVLPQMFNRFLADLVRVSELPIE